MQTVNTGSVSGMLGVLGPGVLWEFLGGDVPLRPWSP